MRRVRLELPELEPRWYQQGFMSALDAGYKRVCVVAHRRW